MFSKLCGALLISAAIAGPAFAVGGVPMEAGAMPEWEAKRTVLYLRLYARANNFSGMAYISRDGNPFIRRAFGLADADRGISNTPTTRYPVAALSRVFTGAALLLLDQEGKLNASDPAVAGLFRSPDSDAAIVELIEQASGQRLGDFMKQRIFAPLQLRGTSVEGYAAESSGQIAVGTEPVGLHDVRNMASAGSTRAGTVITTPADVCDFARAVWNGGFLSAASLEKVRTGGYGWVTRERARHNAVGGEGHAPGFGASLDYFPESRTCVAILTNTNTMVAQVVAPDIATIAMGSPVERPTMGYETPKRGALVAFSGIYQLPANFTEPNATVRFEDRGNYLQATWSNGSTSVVYPAGGDEFVDRNKWARVRFTRDSAGAVTGFEYRLLQTYTATKVQGSYTTG